MMEETSVEKKILHISPAVQALIPDVPKAKELLEQLEKEGYEVQDIVEYGDVKEQGVIGHIVTQDTKAATNYSIYNADGLIQVLSKFLSPVNSNAPHSPPAQRGYQQGTGEPNLLRMSSDRSADYEIDPERGEVKLNGLQPESKSFFTKWCSWFACCCVPEEDRNPLLSSPRPRGSKPH